MKTLFIAAALFVSGSLAEATTPDSKTTIWMGPNQAIIEAAQLIDRGNIQAGIELTEQTLADEDLHPYDRAAAYNNLCVANLGLELYRDALKFCTSAQRIRPGMWQAFNNMGNAYIGLAEYDKAIRNYHKAMRLRPDLEILEYNLFLAMSLKQRKDPPRSPERDG